MSLKCFAEFGEKQQVILYAIIFFEEEEVEKQMEINSQRRSCKIGSVFSHIQLGQKSKHESKSGKQYCCAFILHFFRLLLALK